MKSLFSCRREKESGLEQKLEAIALQYKSTHIYRSLNVSMNISVIRPPSGPILVRKVTSYCTTNIQVTYAYRSLTNKAIPCFSMESTRCSGNMTDGNGILYNCSNQVWNDAGSNVSVKIKFGAPTSDPFEQTFHLDFCQPANTAYCMMMSSIFPLGQCYQGTKLHWHLLSLLDCGNIIKTYCSVN